MPSSPVLRNDTRAKFSLLAKPASAASAKPALSATISKQEKELTREFFSNQRIKILHKQKQKLKFYINQKVRFIH